MLQRYLILCLFLFIDFSPSFAQEWQWERYEGDFYNPTRFPLGFPTCIGDFDGNGTDDFVNTAGSDWYYTPLDENAEAFHWLPPESTIGGADILGMSIAFDLDGDGADELIRWPSFSSSDTISACWKLVSTEPWTWEQRDDLLDPWMDFGEYYEFIEGAFGDIDGDGLMNFVCESPYDCICTGLDVWEYDAEGHPTLEYTYFSHSWFGLDYIIGDPDNDGDDDLIFIADSIYTPGYDFLLMMFENNGSPLDEPVILASHKYNHGSIGDFNGDGQDELILIGTRRVENRNSDGGYSSQIHLTRINESLGISTLFDLTPFHGRVLGNLRPGEETFAPITGHTNWFERTHNSIAYGTLEQYYTPNGWVDFDSGIDRDGLTYCTSFYENSAYMCPSMLQVFSTFQSGNIVQSWETYELMHMTDGDYMEQSGGVFYLRRFYENEDTLFSSPQLGNIRGDESPEYFMLAEYDDQPSRVMIFEADIPWELVQNERLSLGLPKGVDAIRTVDLDGDGYSEILTRNDERYWRLFYFEVDRWYDYSTILPDFESTELGFADFDNNGTIDIFTDDDVWISLSPSPASENSVFSPSSFSLSCFPNPFNPATTLRFNLPNAGKVSLDIYNIRGQLVETLTNQILNAGEHTVRFDGSALPSGVYFARLLTTEQTITHKLLLLK